MVADALGQIDGPGSLLLCFPWEGFHEGEDMMFPKFDEDRCVERSLGLLIDVRECCAFAPGFEFQAALVLLHLSAASEHRAGTGLSELAALLRMSESTAKRLICFLIAGGVATVVLSDLQEERLGLTDSGREVASRLSAVAQGF